MSNYLDQTIDQFKFLTLCSYKFESFTVKVSVRHINTMISLMRVIQDLTDSKFDQIMTNIDQIRSVGFTAVTQAPLLTSNPEILYCRAVERVLATYFNFIELNKLLAQWLTISDPNIWGLRDSYISHSKILGNRSHAPHAQWISKQRTLQIMCKMLSMGSTGHQFTVFILNSMSRAERNYYHQKLSNKRVRKCIPYKPPRRGHHWLRPCEAQILEIINAM